MRYIKDIELQKPGFLGGDDKWRLSDLSDLTVVFGKNGSGKSIMLRAFRDVDPSNHHYVVPERGGEIEFKPNLLNDEFDAKRRKGSSESNLGRDYRDRIVTRVQAYFTARGAYDGKELRGNLEKLEAFFSQKGDLETLLSMLVTDFTITLRGDNTPPYILSRNSDPNPNQISSINNLSSGEAQLITLALDILTVAAIWALQNTEKRLMLVDEPDAHIHPDLQVRFADFLTEVSRRFSVQFVVATHSTAMLAALGQFGKESVSVIYMNREASDFKAIPFDAYMKELAACLGGHALMGPLFGVPLLLVEGDDDFRIWSQVPRHHITNFAVIPSNGSEQMKKYQRALEKIFESLRDNNESPAGFALLDGDQALPQANPDTPQNHVPFIKLKCREAENLYLSDEVLALLEMTWEQASGALAEKATDYGDEIQVQLQNATNWNRAEIDLKGLITPIAEIIDPKKLPWTNRVATTIGRARPDGQLAEFLGGDVLAAFWNDPEE